MKRQILVVQKLGLGYVEKGLSVKNARSYILTEDGISKILELGGKK